MEDGPNSNLMFGLRMAREGARRSDFKIKIGAALVNKGLILVAHNSTKTQPAVLYHGYQFPNQSHAEFQLFNHTTRNVFKRTKGICYVYREHADGKLALAKPCASCLAYLDWMGIRTIIHTVYDGWERIRL